MKLLSWLCAALLAFVLPVVCQADAAEAKQIGLELNDLQPAESGCLAVFVVHNGLGDPLDKLSLRVVAFDAEQHAKLFLSLDVGALPVDKTRVLRFDLGSSLKCSDVGRLVLDDVIACEGAKMDPQKCLMALALSSRAAVPIDF